MQPAKIDLIYIESGGGHRAAATALAEAIRQQQRPWDIRMLSMQELLNSIDFIQQLTGIQFQEIYNIMLRRGWTLGTKHLIPVMHLLIRMSHRAQVRVLEEFWRQDRPDLVVSLIPHYNRALLEALTNVWPGVPMVTVLTDIADHPPHFWIERQDQHVICGSDKAVEQARALQLESWQILQTSGMILHPRFYAPPAIDREMERERLGLDPRLPVGLVLFGGEGSMELVRIAKELNHTQYGVQLILLCGKHEEARQALRALDRRIPMVIEGFTREVPYYMALSDFFIGKPGPGSISEALAMKLPVIVEENAWTLAHERYNCDWIRENEVGLVVGSFAQIGSAVRELLAPERYWRYRSNASALRNHAVFEIPAMLENILAGQTDTYFDQPLPTVAAQ
jgi:UDP-N-acetylglucosamine:LPS N-acetylglucosamine transferase